MTTKQTLRGIPIFPAALVLAFVGGAAALAHQLLWTRRLIDLLGASHEASTRVFGVFFLGLALGSVAAALTIGRLKRPWRFLGLMELGIGVLALPVAFLPWWTGWLWPALGPDALVGSPGGWVKLAVSLICLLPPSFCMGFFIPVVARELAREHSSTSPGGRTLALYAANTLGGVAGLAITAGFAIHTLGLLGAMLATVGANIFVAAGCGWLARADSPASEHHASPVTNSTPASITPNACRALAFFSGLAVLSVEVLLVTLLGLVVPVSFYGPAAMLALVILALAIAAAIVALPWMRKLDPAKLMVAVLLLSAILLVVSPWLFHSIAAGAPSLVKAASAIGFVAKLTVLVTLSFGAAMLLAGMIFPITILLAERTQIGCHARDWGWLLAWNGIGALLGAELTYRFLLPAAGLHASFVWVACGYAAIALMVAIPMHSLSRGGLSLATLAACFFLAIPKLEHLPVVNPHIGFVVHEILVGREGVVTVVEHPRMGKGILLSNQYLLGSTSARWNQERQAHLPLLLHHAPRRVGFLGVATGNTPAAALRHSAVASLDAVEISPLVVHAAQHHFQDLNHPLFLDARARVIVEDGRTWFAASRNHYDVIVGDLFQPWGPGEGRLFSTEHFTSTRAALAHGGIFCQWLPGHQLTRDEFDMIVATFADVFGTVEIFAAGFIPNTPLIALVGWKNDGLDWNVVRDRCNHERRAGGVRDPLMRHSDGIQMLHLTTIQNGKIKTPINTLDNNRVELSAGRRQIRGAGSQNTLHGPAWLAWLREQSSLHPLAKLLHEAEFRAIQSRTPLSRSTDGADLWLDFPSSIRSDINADWTRWPGTIRPR